MNDNSVNEAIGTMLSKNPKDCIPNTSQGPHRS